MFFFCFKPIGTCKVRKVTDNHLKPSLRKAKKPRTFFTWLFWQKISLQSKNISSEFNVR